MSVAERVVEICKSVTEFERSLASLEQSMRRSGQTHADLKLKLDDYFALAQKAVRRGR